MILRLSLYFSKIGIFCSSFVGSASQQAWSGLSPSRISRSKHRAGHRIPNLLSSLFGLRSFAAFTFYKVWFFSCNTCNISTRCCWYVSQKCSSLPVLAAKSEGSEFGVPPSVKSQPHISYLTFQPQQTQPCAKEPAFSFQN